MPHLILDISMSLDGYSAGPDPSLEEPLGKGGEELHEWVIQTAAWRSTHGREGGEENPDSELVEEAVADVGATVMGRKMFSNGSGPWESDPRAGGWWGSEPPFHHDVFVLTHHEREPEEMEGGTTFHFVTDGVETALESAKEAAGGKNVRLAGGADVAQQYLNAGLVDAVNLHVAPFFLGGGTPLFAGLGEMPGRLERTFVQESPTGTVHLFYRVERD